MKRIDKTLYYNVLILEDIKEIELEFSIDDRVKINRLARLLSLRGFDYICKSHNLFPDCLILKINEYFDLDLFMEIVDTLKFKRFVEDSCKNREQFREEMLAILV